MKVGSLVTIETPNMFGKAAPQGNVIAMPDETGKRKHAGHMLVKVTGEKRPRAVAPQHVKEVA